MIIFIDFENMSTSSLVGSEKLTSRDMIYLVSHDTEITVSFGDLVNLQNSGAIVKFIKVIDFKKDSCDLWILEAARKMKPKTVYILSKDKIFEDSSFVSDNTILIKTNVKDAIEYEISNSNLLGELLNKEYEKYMESFRRV